MAKSTRKSAARKPKKAPRKATETARKGGKATGKTRPTDAAIVAAALALAAERGWRALSLDDIAAAAGVTLADLHRQFASKESILAAFTRRIDDQVLGAGPADGTSVRDRLFEVVMRRFDALQPHREAVRRIVRESPCEPSLAALRMCRLIRSMAWTLEAAGLRSSGIAGALKTKGLTAVYLVTLRQWLTDDSVDLGPTMAALDRGLGRAGALAAAVFARPGRGAGKGAEAG